jgi:Sporulation and spore germination
MPRWWKIGVGVLALLAFGALLTFPSLLRSVLGLRRATRTEEQARRAIVPPISTPSDTREKAQIFWLSPSSPDTLEANTVELNLSADPEQRAKQLITALIEKAPSQVQRTLPADTSLLQFYLLSDGTGIADFSETLETETPSGILNEEMAIDSIVRTLGANLSNVYRLKILIRGQDAETLAGHLDLSEFFAVPAQTAPQIPVAAAGAAPPQPSAEGVRPNAPLKPGPAGVN